MRDMVTSRSQNRKHHGADGDTQASRSVRSEQRQSASEDPSLARRPAPGPEPPSETRAPGSARERASAARVAA